MVKEHAPNQRHRPSGQLASNSPSPGQVFFHKPDEDTQSRGRLTADNVGAAKTLNS